MAVKAKAEITISRITDIQSVTRYYLLQSSSSAVPSRPTDNPPGGNWATTEPAFQNGSTNTLYFVDQTIYTNGTVYYSLVSKSSSYEAAKEAYNKATSAKDAADSANDKVDNMEIGGRNYLYTSKLLPVTTNGITFTPTKDGGITISGENNTPSGYGSAYCFVKGYIVDDGYISLPAGTYTMSLSGDEYYTNMAGDTNLFYYRIIRDSAYGPPIQRIMKGNTAWFTLSEDVEKVYVGFGFHTGAVIQEGTVYLKLEKGNVATDWSPAPEDAMDDVDVEYYLSTSSTSLSGGSWSTTAPAWVDGKYIWSRTVKIDGAGNKTYTEPQCVGQDTGAINEKFDSITDNIQTDLDNKDVNTFSALSIDGGETLASYNLADYLESGTLTNGTEADSTTHIRSNEYIKVSEGEVYTWNAKNASGTAVTPTTFFYNLNESTGAYTYLSSQSTNNITVPTNDNVYIRFTMVEIRSDEVDTICTLAINGIDDLLNDSSATIYIGLYSTLNAYASVDPDDYEWRMADSTILANSQFLFDALNNKLYDETNGDIKKLTDAVDGAQKTADDVNTKIDNRNKYIQILPNEATIRLLADGNGVNPSSEVKMTSDKISFSHDGVEGAYIGYPDAEQSDRTAMAANKTYITEMYPRAEDPASDGNWIGSLCWVARTNGHLSLKVVK